MTGPAVPSDEELREALAEALRLHHPLLLTGHVSCSCGWRSETSFHIELTTSRHREHVAHVVEVLVVDDRERHARQRAAEEIERLADERTWTTEHDNEVVSTRELYEQVARLRGELEPVTYDFPPNDALDGEPQP